MSNWFKTFLAFVCAIAVVNASGLTVATNKVGKFVCTKIENMIPKK